MLEVLARQRSASFSGPAEQPQPQQQEQPQAYNCTSWGEFETIGSSETAKLCHGGIYQGTEYPKCAGMRECRSEKIRRTAEGKVHLPISMNPMQPPPRQQAPQQAPQQRPPLFRPMEFTGPRQAPSTLPGNRYPQHAVETSFPQPVIPPETYPEAMRTPYASAAPVYGGGTSPTFLPQGGENVFERLSKNMVQGAISAMGWHVFDYLRAVDLFRR